ncbi:MAG: efflux transporter outer membrane subunit [Deltaproteobacteria bacterium]|nr:efflux transporter outer membrane subunit [Deltaproteobacteria bacterium]
MTAARRSLLALAVWALPLVGVGCSVGPDYVRPDTTALESFRAPTTATESIVNLNWWDLYDDPVLQRLIGTAIEHNRDARVALLRITESRLLAGIVRADLYPTLSVGGQLSAMPTVTTDGDFAPVANAAFAVDMSYEIDLWGRVRRSNEAAFHEVLASEEAYRNVLISLIAEVAAQYFTLIDLDNRLAITEQTIAMRTRGLNTVEARFRGGLTTEIDFRQSEIQLHVVEASLASYRQFIGLTENSLSVLLGQPPHAIPRGRPLFSQVVPPAVPVGLPSEVVRRRPDIREAERRLHAQNARIGVARANRFPQFSLTGPAGVTAVLTNPSLATGFLTLGANLLSPLFNGGRLRRQEQIEVTRTEQLTRVRGARTPDGVGPGRLRHRLEPIPRGSDDLSAGRRHPGQPLLRAARALPSAAGVPDLRRVPLQGAWRRVAGGGPGERRSRSLDRRRRRGRYGGRLSLGDGVREFALLSLAR